MFLYMRAFQAEAKTGSLEGGLAIEGGWGVQQRRTQLAHAAADERGGGGGERILWCALFNTEKWYQIT